MIKIRLFPLPLSVKCSHGAAVFLGYVCSFDLSFFRRCSKVGQSFQPGGRKIAFGRRFFQETISLFVAAENFFSSCRHRGHAAEHFLSLLPLAVLRLVSVFSFSPSTVPFFFFFAPVRKISRILPFDSLHSGGRFFPSVMWDEGSFFFSFSAFPPGISRPFCW